MKVRYRVVPKQNKKSSFYVNCHTQHVTIQAADSAFSTFYSYEIENGVARMYCFFAYIPEFSEGYTVYINQDAVVIN